MYPTTSIRPYWTAGLYDKIHIHSDAQGRPNPTILSSIVNCTTICLPFYTSQRWIASIHPHQSSICEIQSPLADDTFGCCVCFLSIRYLRQHFVSFVAWIYCVSCRSESEDVLCVNNCWVFPGGAWLGRRVLFGVLENIREMSECVNKRHVC